LCDAAQEVLEESHDHRCKIWEHFHLPQREYGQIFEGIKANHEHVCSVTYRLCGIKQIIVEATVKVTPLQQRDFGKPEINRTSKTACGIGSIIVSLGTSQEGVTISLCEVFIILVKVIAQVVHKLFWLNRFLLQIDDFGVVI
jgi:hypothetical protein